MPPSSQASRELSTASFTAVSSAFRGLSNPSRCRFLAKNSLTEISRCFVAIVSAVMRRRVLPLPSIAIHFGICRGQVWSSLARSGGTCKISPMQPLIFESIWQDLEVEYGRPNLRFPKELILLGGAPGSGKGTNTAFISRTRGLTCAPIVISALLESPEAKAMKDAGHLAGDREVVSLLLRELLRDEYHHGAIIDGFPRTNVQVECLKLLVDKIGRASCRE